MIRKWLGQILSSRLGVGGRFLTKPVPNQAMRPMTDGRGQEEPGSHAALVP